MINNMGILSKDQLMKMGFKSVGNNVLVSDKASFYNTGNISIGNDVRIDDFCVFSAGEEGIEIGNYIHIACYTSLIGKGRIQLEDFCNLSSRISIYSSNDDYSGEFLTNPMVPSKYTNVNHAAVNIGKHVIIGSGSVILPGVTIGRGVSIGALSLVSSDCESNKVYAGIPCRYIKDRKLDYLKLEKEMLNGE